MMGVLCLRVTVVIHSDSSACKGMCNRRGLGKLKHMEVELLWLQHCVQSGKVALRRIACSASLANLFTKYSPGSEIVTHSGRLGFSAVLGRSI